MLVIENKYNNLTAKSCVLKRANVHLLNKTNSNNMNTQTKILTVEELEANYIGFLKSSKCIGFTSCYPIKEVIETFEINSTCLKFDVVVEVKLCTTDFGLLMLVTEPIRVSDKMPLSGWGQGYCYDEAETMEKAIVDVCRVNEFMICAKECSWPFAKAIVQRNYYPR